VVTLKRDAIEAGRNKIWIKLDGVPYNFEPPAVDSPQPEEEQEVESDIPF
jgi:hypothetical protein